MVSIWEDLSHDMTKNLANLGVLVRDNGAWKQIFSFMKNCDNSLSHCEVSICGEGKFFQY